MTSRQHTGLWVGIPLVVLGVVLCIKWGAPEHNVETAPPQAQEHELPPAESPVGHIVEVCPTETMPGFYLGGSAYLSDYSGGSWASTVTEQTTVRITCGEQSGDYELYTMDFNDLYDEPDVVLETCGDAYCTSAYGMVMLERIET